LEISRDVVCCLEILSASRTTELSRAVTSVDREGGRVRLATEVDESSSLLIADNEGPNIGLKGAELASPEPIRTLRYASTFLTRSWTRPRHCWCGDAIEVASWKEEKKRKEKKR